jgi:NAD(P)-dependent dehydrogenase (short-subunit alcohol dehydrogenase family)
VIRSHSGGLADALGSLSMPDGALVFAANSGVSNEWPAVLDELTEAFDLSQAAVRSGGPIVYVVDGDDLLGRGGIGGAMVACGLLSAARTLALETARAGTSVNVVAVGAETSPETVAHWVEALCRPDGPSGELIRLGVDHLGKALP